jgi:hypothetical protein
MKEIVPINIWYNGQNVQANFLQLFCINDNLLNSANFTTLECLYHLMVHRNVLVLLVLSPNFSLRPYST